MHGFSPGFVLPLSYRSWFCLASTTRLIQIRSGAEHRIPFLPLTSLHGLSPGFVWLLSHSSWFCAVSTTRLIQNPKRSVTLDSIEQFEWIISWFCMASLPQLLVLFGFHNSLNTNPKRSGTSDFILTFVQEQLSVSYGTRTSM